MKKGAYKDVTVSGSTIMNQCGSLLTRKKHQIKGSNKQKNYTKALCYNKRNISSIGISRSFAVFFNILEGIW